MPVYDLYSKRQKRLRGEVPDIYQYDNIPKELRVQVIHIWKDVIGISLKDSGASDAYREIDSVLCREYGLDNLAGNANAFEDLTKFFLSCNDQERVLDVIELSFNYIDLTVRANPSRFSVRGNPNAAIAELNTRFFEHGIGYQYESKQLIRKDSEFLHSEAVKPVLLLLSDPLYKSANEEFLKAHEHYRHQNYKECLNECLKAFESTMKIICDKRGWTYKQTDTASTLINICFTNGLIPSHLQSQFGAIKSALESGIPTARNKQGAHGQGPLQIVVPDYLASYMLHMTASTILLLVNSEKALP
jgi:AbiJ N-terminal domain 4